MMPYRLRLVNDDETEELDLLHGPLRVANWGWTTQPAPLKQSELVLPFGNQASSVGYSPAIESLSLATFGCQDDIRQAVRSLETFLENAAAHHDDPLVYSPQWIEWITPGEAPKRSLLTGGTWSPVTNPPIWPMLEGTILRVNSAIRRHPLWENVSISVDSKAPVGSDVSSVGGTYLITGNEGDVPSRIESMRFGEGEDIIYPYLGGLAAITKIWAGFRPEYKGLTDFVPVWECESTGTPGGHSTIDDAATLDNAAPLYISSNVSTAQTTFVDTNLNRILHITINNVSGGANYSHFAGRYLVLCRCWVDAGEAFLQMRHGWEDSASVTACDPVKVDNDRALYKELGTIQIPPPGLWETYYGGFNDQCGRFTIWLYSQNVDADTMDLDCLVLIPADYIVKVEDAYIWTEAAANYYSVIETLPNERVIGYSYGVGATYRANMSVSPNQWYMPHGTSLLVVAGEEAADQVVDDMINIIPRWYPRWISYRQ